MPPSHQVKPLRRPKKDIVETEYLLTQPYVIHKKSSGNIVTSSPPAEDQLYVTPKIVGICGSDIHYFKGDKDQMKLTGRLPVVPLHEGVVYIEDVRKNASVIPFIKCGECPACTSNRENLCVHSAYMGSTAPGLARSGFYYPENLLIEVPENVPLSLATLLEPISIIYRMLQEVSFANKTPIAVLGTGLIGRLAVVFLSSLAGVSKENLYLIGRKESKLEKFSDICETVNYAENPGIFEKLKDTFQIVIEAVGGHSMPYTLSYGMTIAQPGAELLILGLSDDVNHVNFTTIANKGLILKGISRSLYKDYLAAMALLEKNEKLAKLLERVIDNRRIVIQNEYDLMDAYHYAMSGRNDGRVLVNFE